MIYNLCGTSVNSGKTMNQDNINQIENYITICKKLANSRFIKETKNIQFSLSFKQHEATKVSIGNFDEDLLRSCLMDFRKVYLPKEKTNFSRICNILLQCTDDQKIKENIEKCRKKYKFTLKNSSVGFAVNNDRQEPDKIIDDWLHGYYFHEDEGKKKVIENLHITQLLHKTIFLNTITDLIRISIILSNNAKLVLERSSQHD